MSDDPKEDKFVAKVLDYNKKHGKQAQVSEQEARDFYRRKQAERKGRKTRKKSNSLDLDLGP